MRFSGSIAAIAAVAALAAPVAALGDDGHGPDYFRVINVAAGDVLNVRALPSGSADKVGELPPDADGIHYDFCIGETTYQEWTEMSDAEREAATRLRWCRISWNGVSGWAAGRFLGEGDSPVTVIEME